MTNAELFKKIFGIYATELWSMPEEDFLRWLNTETVAEVPHWIPCEERMPEKYDQYLCCTREGVFHTPCLDDSELAIVWAKDEDVVAWMPLPEPYKEEEEQ